MIVIGAGRQEHAMRLAQGGLTVAIVGGGFSGAAVAAHLARDPAFGKGRIVVFEPRPHLGRGLAYDTDNNAHRVNVPANRMSLDVNDDDHFVRWLDLNDEISRDPAALASDGKVYPRRGVFGRYVSDYVKPYLLSGVVRHEQSRVVAVQRAPSGWVVIAENGARVAADILVIATSHPAPQSPKELDQPLKGHPRYVRDTTTPDALDGIRREDRVLVVGAGLTSADVISTLGQRGHIGPITVFSRRGLRSRGHAAITQEPFGDFLFPASTTVLALVRRVREAIKQAEAEGRSWHAVFDALRAQGGMIWRRLPIAERRKLVCHLRPFWDVHRFRIAPQVETVLEDGLRSGRLRFLAASLMEVTRAGEAVEVTLRRRGGGIDHNVYDAVVVTTGPAHGGILASQKWLAGLGEVGLLRVDETGLGLSCDDASRALRSDWRAISDLFISGPLARGTFGELMGLPQVNEHAILVANSIARLAEQGSHAPIPIVGLRGPAKG
jgi:uncharacterized NAD(P)/FAD-binding protein YdhS